MPCLTPWDKQTARIFDTGGAWHSLFANSDKSGMARDAVLTIRKNKRASHRVMGDCRVDSFSGCEFPDEGKARQ
jgi:hypothetical protein